MEDSILVMVVEATPLKGVAHSHYYLSPLQSLPQIPLPIDAS
jgi:hypothetical protein